MTYLAQFQKLFARQDYLKAFDFVKKRILLSIFSNIIQDTKQDYLLYFYIFTIKVMNPFHTKSTFLILHKNLQYALEISDQTIQKKSQVEMGPINQNNKRQLWLLDGKKNQAFQIINGFSDHSLTEQDGVLVLKRGTASKHQTWTFQFCTDHDVTIRLSKSKTKYIGVEDGQLIIKQAKFNTFADVWTLEEVKNNIVLNQSCFIKSTDKKQLIDVPEATKKQGQQLLIYTPNYRYNQRWNIFRAGQIYIIKSFYNKLNLDIQDENYEDQAKIIQWSSHGGINQFWRFEKVDLEKPIYRIFTCYDKDLQLGHKNHKVVLHKGRKFTWQIDGYMPI